jgi:hypothetical protein
VQTQCVLLGALLCIVDHQPHASVGLALSGAVPALLHLHRRRRSPLAVRHLSARLLCSISSHGEVGAHCMYQNVLPALLSLLTDHDDPDVRHAASHAAKTLLSPLHAIHQLLVAGGVAPLLALLHSPRRGMHAECASWVEEAMPLLERAALAAQSALRNATVCARATRAAQGDDGGEGGEEGEHDTCCHLEESLLLARFGGVRELRTHTRSLISACLSINPGLTAAASAAGETGPRSRALVAEEARTRACDLRRACAHVLCFLLRGGRPPEASQRGVAAPAERPPPQGLAVQAAIAVFEGLADKLDAEARGELVASERDEEEGVGEPRGIEAAVLEEVTLRALGVD